MNKSEAGLSIVAQSESEDSFVWDAHELGEGSKDTRKEMCRTQGLQSSRLCAVHRKKAELICLNDYSLVCTDCAIFGEHRTHEMKTVEEVLLAGRKMQSDIGRVAEECKYSLELLSNDEFSRRLLEQHYASGKESIRKNFALLRELIDTLEVAALKELDAAYTEQLSELKEIYRKDRPLNCKFHFWTARGTDEVIALNQDAPIGEFSRRLYTESEEVLQGGFDVLSELERHRSMQLQRTNLLAKRLHIRFDYDCLDQIERFVRITNDREDILLEEVEGDCSSIVVNSQQASHQFSEMSEVCTLQPATQTEFEVLEVREDSTTVADLETSLLSVKTAPTHRRQKRLKLSEKQNGIYKQLGKDKLETLDLTNAELGDEILMGFCEELPQKKVRNAKLIRNKLTDAGLERLLPSFVNLVTLNLSQNTLTDRSVDLIIDALSRLPRLRNLVLSQNRIKERSVRGKLKYFQERGICVSL